MKQPLSQTAKTEIGKYFFLLSVTTYAGGVLTQLMNPNAKLATITAGFVVTLAFFAVGLYFLRGTK